MKVSDYIVKFIENIGVKDIFLISGGGMMHLLDSVAKNKQMNIICNLNEQATSICADSYGQFTNNLGVCMVTTGPGGTNAVTGVAASWLDSTPVLVISGQVKIADFAKTRGVRQFGAQEVDIVSIVEPITKYAIIVDNKESIRYHLEKALYLATTNRKGPVWLDIPLDIQAAQVEVDELKGFDPSEEGFEEVIGDLEQPVRKVYEILNKSQRPVFLIGHGVIASGKAEVFKKLAKKLGIPVLSTWRAKGVFSDEDDLYFGHPGIPTTRYSNYVLQNSDTLIIIGTRLNVTLTAYDEKHFAINAKKVIVDIDENEMNKLDMEFELKIKADAGKFIDQMKRLSSEYKFTDLSRWLAYCKQMKEKYPLIKEKQPIYNEGLVDGFLFADSLSKYVNREDIFVGSSSGRTCGISHMAYKVKEEQKFISSMGLGSMGFTVPSAIACCLASNKQRTIAIEGDGSLQHNIQELQLINTYKLPIKLFILSNSGYASIYMMQKNNFKQNYAACNESTNIMLPNLRDIANTYKLEYYLIENNEYIEDILVEAMKDDRPILCEVKSSIFFDEIPKSMTRVNGDGTFSSSLLEDLYPFLPEKEVKENMPKWDIE